MIAEKKTKKICTVRVQKQIENAFVATADIFRHNNNKIAENSQVKEWKDKEKAKKILRRRTVTQILSQ